MDNTTDHAANLVGFRELLVDKRRAAIAEALKLSIRGNGHLEAAQSLLVLQGQIDAADRAIQDERRLASSD